MGIESSGSPWTLRVGLLVRLGKAYVQEPRSPLPLHMDLMNFVPGSFDEVQAALDDGLIDEAIYGLVLDALRSQ